MNLLMNTRVFEINNSSKLTENHAIREIREDQTCDHVYKFLRLWTLNKAAAQSYGQTINSLLVHFRAAEHAMRYVALRPATGTALFGQTTGF